MNKYFKNILAVAMLALSLLPATALADDVQIESKVPAQVLSVVSETRNTDTGDQNLIQELEVKPESGPYKNKKIQAENDNTFVPGEHQYKPGDEVFLVSTQSEAGGPAYKVYDYNRLSALLWLFILFVVVTVLIARLQGITSFIGMACSFLIIFYYVLPQILGGSNSFLVAIIAALFIVPITFYLSHGLNRKTTAAIIGTMVTLIIVGFVSTISVSASHLNGAASDEVNTLEMEKPGVIDLKELLLAGIIISLLGILNDITISQAAIVYKLKEVSPELKIKGLFTKAMDVGRDHIASVVNTLVLVYTGAALPLLLLFLTNPAPFTEILNEEFMAEEILRTLIASIGIVIAVPLTTMITALIVSRGLPKSQKSRISSHDGHIH